jgi:hypothetical protein
MNVSKRDDSRFMNELWLLQSHFMNEAASLGAITCSPPDPMLFTRLSITRPSSFSVSTLIFILLLNVEDKDLLP